MPTLLSMREYAKHRGCSAMAVSKAVKAGRITAARDVSGKAMIDPAVADAEWARNTDQAQQREPAPALAPVDAGEAGEGKKESRYQQSQAVLKTYQARLAKLEFDERSGTLLSAADVKRDSFETARIVRDALMALPQKLAPELAGETDQFAIHKRLDDEIRRALETLSTAEA